MSKTDCQKEQNRCVEKVEKGDFLKKEHADWLQAQEQEIIRAELNLCKMLSIWETSQSKKKSKVIELTEDLPNGSQRVRRIVIGQVGRAETGTFTVKKHLKTLLALIKLHEQAGRPDQVTFGVHQLAECLNLTWGRSTYNYLKEALEGLRVIPIRLENVFYNKETDETEELIDYFTWLDDLKICGKLKNRQVNTAYSTFTFNKAFRQNILSGYTKPLFLSVITNLKTEVGILLYNHLDLVLADKNRYERNLKNLIEIDFKLDGKYSYSSDRKKLFLKPIKELSGVKLSTGILAKISLEKTKDGGDYKIVCQKMTPASIKKMEQQSLNSRQKIDVNNVSSNVNEVQEVVKYFLKVLGNTHRQAKAKELEQAEFLIKKHGVDKSKYLIDYAIKSAQKTNFKMQWFGAILDYVEQGSESYDQENRSDNYAEIADQDRQLEEEYETYILAKIERYKGSIGQEKLEKLSRKSEKFVYKKYPDLARNDDQKDDNFKALLESFFNDWLIDNGLLEVLDYEGWRKR